MSSLLFLSTFFRRDNISWTFPGSRLVALGVVFTFQITDETSVTSVTSHRLSTSQNGCYTLGHRTHHFQTTIFKKQKTKNPLLFTLLVLMWKPQHFRDPEIPRSISYPDSRPPLATYTCRTFTNCVTQSISSSKKKNFEGKVYPPPQKKQKKTHS